MREIPADWAEGPSAAAEDSALVNWWSNFADPMLTDLVESALASNTDIVAAQGRLRAARASLVYARGAMLPSVSGTGTANRRESIEGPDFDTKTYALALDAGWELDIFGRLRGSTAAAVATVEGSEAALYDIRRIISAEVALAYIDLRDAQARLGISRENLRTQEGNLQIADWRNQAGLGDALEVEQARTITAQTRATIPPLEQAVARSMYRLDVLTGSAPGHNARRLTPSVELGAPPTIDATGLPAQLLERRPDVVSARKALEVEVLRIGVAQADLYPTLRLSGSLDTAAQAPGDLFDVSVGSLIGGVTAPIFQGGQIRARIEQQRGEADAALANYRSAVLAALQDVENALRSVRSSREREARLKDAEQSALAGLQLAEIRYRSGSIDFQSLLDSQRSVLVVQESRAAASAARCTAAVQLFKALGGGWTVASAR